MGKHRRAGRGAWLGLGLAGLVAAVALGCGSKDKKLRARENEAGAGGQEMIVVEAPGGNAGEPPFATPEGGTGGAGGATVQDVGGAPTVASNPVAFGTIAGLAGNVVLGTATFEQDATQTTLTVSLTACPDGEHAADIHMMKDCANDGQAAGGHWVPSGEMLGNVTCVDGSGTRVVSKPTSEWTVGDGSATDVTKFALIVHEGGELTAGARIGCATIELDASALQ